MGEKIYLNVAFIRTIFDHNLFPRESRGQPEAGSRWISWHKLNQKNSLWANLQDITWTLTFPSG